MPQVVSTSKLEVLLRKYDNYRCKMDKNRVKIYVEYTPNYILMYSDFLFRLGVLANWNGKVERICSHMIPKITKALERDKSKKKRKILLLKVARQLII